MKQVFFVSVGAVKKSNKLPEVTGNLTRNTKKKKNHLSSTLPFCLRLAPRGYVSHCYKTPDSLTALSAFVFDLGQSKSRVFPREIIQFDPFLRTLYHKSDSATLERFFDATFEGFDSFW